MMTTRCPACGQEWQDRETVPVHGTIDAGRCEGVPIAGTAVALVSVTTYKGEETGQ